MTNLQKLRNDTTKITKKSVTIGGHLSISGGHVNALHKTKEIGGNCLQLFSSSPRNWAVTPPTKEQIQEFVDAKHKLEIDPIYFHASYLINLADNGPTGEKSVQTLIDELQLAKKMKVKGTIIHLGSFKLKEERPSDTHYDVLFRNINIVLQNTPEETLFIIENAGNKKICCSLKELGFIVKELNNPRVKVCLDTCHLYAAGYDLSTLEKFAAYFTEFEKKVGLENLEVFQINDSKDPLGSFRDRHENIGEGEIPLETFRLLLTDKRTRNKPFILETPGFDKNGPDKRNIETLKQLRIKKLPSFYSTESNFRTEG